MLVRATEIPGSLFKLDLQFEVDTNGMVTTRPESSFTMPSLQKVLEAKQSHPGRIL